MCQSKRYFRVEWLVFKDCTWYNGKKYYKIADIVITEHLKGV